MTTRFSPTTIANTLFDTNTINVPPMVAPYGYGMPFVAYSHSEVQILPTLEEAANTLHDQGMSKHDLMLLSKHLRDFLLTQLTPELVEKDTLLHTHIATDPEAYLGMRISAPLKPLETRENISDFKSAFTASVSELMDKNPSLFSKPAPRAKRFGQRNFGLTRNHG